MTEPAARGSEESGGGPLLVEVAAAHAGMRTDRFLAEATPSLSRSRIKGLMEAGHVRRDGQVVRLPAEPYSSSTCGRTPLQPTFTRSATA